MGQTDWYRQTAWSPEIEAAFLLRLERSRSGKPQYLRIQGLFLIHTGDPVTVKAGMALTHRALTEFPDDPLQLASCWRALAEGHLALGETEEALVAYRKAWEAELLRPMVNTGARLDLAFLLIRLGRRELADEARRAISDEEDARSAELFPIAAATRSLVLATLAHWEGNRSQAMEYVRSGLAAAAMQRSPLRHHPGLGVVPENSEVTSMLKKLQQELAQFPQHASTRPAALVTDSTSLAARIGSRLNSYFSKRSRK